MIKFGRRFWFAAFVGLALLAFTLYQADYTKLLETSRDVDSLWAVMTLIASFFSYFAIAMVLHLLLKGMGHILSFSTTVSITLVSSAMNYFVPVGGLSGVAAKVYLLARKGIPPSRTLSISIMHGFLTNSIAVIFVYFGFFLLYGKYRMDFKEVMAGVAVMAIAFVLVWLTVQILISSSFRNRFCSGVIRAGESFCRMIRRPHWFHREKAEAFVENFSEGMDLLVANRKMLLGSASYAFLDWLFMFLCLQWSFKAAGYPIPGTAVFVGLSVGSLFSLFSLTPASIGVMEGTMAVAFHHLMGLDYEKALLATLIFRIAYYFIPFGVSLLCSRESLRSTVQGSGPED